MVDSGGAAAGKTAAAAAPSGPSAAGAAGTAGSAGAAGSAGLSPEEVGTLRKLVADLEAQNSKLQVRQLLSLKCQGFFSILGGGCMAVRAA